MPTQNAMRPQVLKVSEVADILRCNHSTVYRLIRDGRIDSVVLGRSYRVRQSAVDKFLGEA